MKKIQCGGFYVDDEAIETREGKPFLKTGGADPIVENAKQTGGFGYTEQGEQTVITWDGDTDGRESVAGMYYLVSENPPSQDAVVDGARITFNNGDVLEVTADFIYPISDTMYNIDNGTYTVCMVATEDGDIEGVVVNKGTYFFKAGTDYITSLTYGTPDTIHKIDEKYLPASGGGSMVVVPCILNPETMDAELTDTGVAVMDKINTDYQNGNIYPVLCKLSIEIGGLSVDAYSNLSGWSVLDGSVGLSFASNDVDRGDFKSQIVKIAKVSGEWVVQILTASIPLGS